MKLKKKIFLSILIPLVLFCAILSISLMHIFSEKYTEAFNKFYSSVAQSITDTLVQIDMETDKNIKNVELLIKQDEHKFEAYSNDQLKQVSKQLNVSHLFTIDGTSGRFLTSSCEPPEELPSVYDYCKNYKSLINGNKKSEMTPLVYGKPELEAYKFYLFPNRGKTKIFEIAIHARFLGRTLRKAIDSYSSISSIGLYAPNGDSLGLFNRNNEIGRVEKIQFSDKLKPVNDLGDKILFYAKVPTAIKDCCECEKHLDSSKNGKYFYYILMMEVSKSDLNQLLHQTIMRVAALLLLALLISFICAKSLSQLLTKKLNLVNNKIYSIIESGNLNEEVIIGGDDEISQLGMNFNTMIRRIAEFQDKLLKFEKKAAIGEIAQKVAHDIRSPLSALNMMVRLYLRELPEETRIIIRQQIERIQDIANNLLVTNRAISTDTYDIKTIREELLSSLIEVIITEKRLNFRSRLELSIEGDIYDNNSYGLFAQINPMEFKRIISNLINNSVEAMSEYKGRIIVRLASPTQNMVNIIVEDNGKGIPSELLDKLGYEGASFGKEKNSDSGSGIGLYHARTRVEEWGGKLIIESEIGKGSKIIISIPRVVAPKWFVPKIQLMREQAIVILDDDQGIHQTWDNRFKELSLDQYNIKVVHLSNPDTFTEWINKYGLAYKEILYLSDFELLGYQKSGLDLLEEYKLKNSILVTSHYENNKIRERCDQLGVRLIPKMLAGFVPIEINPDIHESALDFCDFIYIDDDRWLRQGWDVLAKEKGIKIITLSSTRDFAKYKHRISKERTSIYLDSNLGENETRGEDFAKILHEEGYEKIYLATGYEADRFLNLPWLTVVGKDCPL